MAQESGDLVGEGDTGEAKEAADEEVAKAKVSGPILGILHILHILRSKEETCLRSLYQ